MTATENSIPTGKKPPSSLFACPSKFFFDRFIPKNHSKLYCFNLKTLISTLFVCELNINISNNLSIVTHNRQKQFNSATFWKETRRGYCN